MKNICLLCNKYFLLARGIFILFWTTNMKALWLSTLLVIGSSLVIAQGNSRTCDITLDRGLTVPRLCYNFIQNRLNDSRRNLNFTLTNDSELIFAPLPENRQVEIEIDDNSDGLESWSNLANAFVDSVRSGSLPYSGKYSRIVLGIAIRFTGNEYTVCLCVSVSVVQF